MTSWSNSNRRLELPPDWQTLRKQVLARDQGLCQLDLPGCTHRATDVHHTGRPDDHRPAVLQSACRSCHQHETTAARPRQRREPEQHPGLT